MSILFQLLYIPVVHILLGMGMDLYQVQRDTHQLDTLMETSQHHHLQPHLATLPIHHLLAKLHHLQVRPHLLMAL